MRRLPASEARMRSPATCIRITEVPLAPVRRDTICEFPNLARRLLDFCIREEVRSVASDSTASFEVRNKLYPLPRARYFTWGSVCPKFGSNATGKLLKLVCLDLCVAGDNIFALPLKDAPCSAMAIIA